FYRALLVGVAAVAIAGCATTGHNFDTHDLRFLVAGETTLEEAKVLLQADPVNIYRQADGAATARWAYGSSLVNDAVYFNRELWRAFDSSGRFVRIVKSHSVPHAYPYEDGRRVDPPAPPRTFPATSSSLAPPFAAPSSPILPTSVPAHATSRPPP